MIRGLRNPRKILNSIERVITGKNVRPWPDNLVDIVEEYSKVGSVLDVGCATGVLLAAARNSGWKTRGVELSDYASQTVRDQYGLEVFTETLQQALQSANWKKNRMTL